jgi:hypothetical protein
MIDFDKCLYIGAEDKESDGRAVEEARQWEVSVCHADE